VAGYLVVGRREGEGKVWRSERGEKVGWLAAALEGGGRVFGCWW